MEPVPALPDRSVDLRLVAEHQDGGKNVKRSRRRQKGLADAKRGSQMVPGGTWMQARAPNRPSRGLCDRPQRLLRPLWPASGTAGTRAFWEKIERLSPLASKGESD